ncbi:acyl-CoA dehydrogenase NM domain-like protein [Marasmius fiardii PR-910]|nr:acyl-CoA dehydrogenase NM domain-like protein [Marasmius fiardii PR-910]
MGRAEHLLSSALFDDLDATRLDDLARTKRSFARAKAIAASHGITSHDVLRCTEKLWNMYLDPITSRDFSAFTLLTIQLNLVAGMVTYFAYKDRRREDLQCLADRIVNFDISAAFLLTEIGHGWDALNLETTATLLPDGSFDLHTPHRGAEKFMSNTLPDVGYPCFGVVMARLVTGQGTDQGVRTFIIQLNDGKSMCRGITARRLPEIYGSPPTRHAMTRFDHVTLPPTALLGPVDSFLRSRLQFLAEGWRINIGAATATIACSIHPLQSACYIVTKYSQLRKIGIPPVPLIKFRTQYRPILHALSRSFVLRSFFVRLRTAGHFDVAWERRDVSEEIRHRSAYATVFKVLSVNLIRESLAELGVRCGAHGLFSYNQLVDGEIAHKASSIAEGEPIGLSARLAVEVLLGHFSFPTARDPKHLLALHETSIFAELLSCISLRDETRNIREPNNRFNDLVLPRANSFIEAIGARIAYEVATSDPDIDPSIVELFSIGCIQRDLAWYVEHRVFSRREVFAWEADTLDVLLPRLEELLNRTGIEPYVHGRICREDWWKKFVDELPVIGSGSDGVKTKL